MSLEAYLAEHQEAHTSAKAIHARDAVLRAWIWGKTPEERLLRFDAWVKLELAARLDWTWAGSARTQRIVQCQIQLETMLRQLFQRGWHLDGRKLADLITKALDEIREAQDAGRVRDFWSFFLSVVTRYVGTHAEEIQAEALSAGAHVGQIFDAIQRHAKPAGPTIPELVAQRAQERLTDRLARQRKAAAQAEADAAQQRLF
jgi:hypothetical protein